MRKEIIYTFIQILALMSFISCNLISPDSNQLAANAGEDQITYVGSYAVLDPSKSNIGDEIVELVQWIQDPNNPEEVSSIGLSLQEPTVVGFVKEGIYKFTLKISCESGNVYTDDIEVTVKPRQESLIEDVNLEIRVRYSIDYKEGPLTADKLQQVDSLWYPNFGFKNRIKNLKGLEYCTELTCLALPRERIQSLQPLSNLTKMEFLDLNQNYTIEDISPIYNLVNLKTLILYSNPIKDISGLGKLIKLKELYLMYTPVTDLSALTNLVNLEILYLSGVGEGVVFNSIEPLKNLTKLRHLHLTGGGVSDIRPLENLTELVLLDVNFNNLTEISAVSKMKKLIRLSIAGNRIVDISGIRNLENLDYLNAMDNKIKDISELQYLSKIHLIGLDANKIEDISPLVKNPYLGKGVYVFISGNPLNEKSINEYIPALIARGVNVVWQ